jgi:hypothetical protein
MLMTLPSATVPGTWLWCSACFQIANSRVSHWTLQNGFTFSNANAKCVLFTRLRLAYILPHIFSLTVASCRLL